jgi:hypothetical protein
MAAILSLYLQEQAAKSFVWGVHDCFTLVAGWLDQVTGRRCLPDWYGQYFDAQSADKFISEGGGFAAIAGPWLEQHYGVKPVKAGMGIAVLAQCQNRKVMGIRVDELHLAFRTASGLLVTKRARVLKEWAL